MIGKTSFLILLLIKYSKNQSTEGIFSCTHKSPHNFDCKVINYNSLSEWLTFNDTLSTILNLYKMEIYAPDDTTNLLEAIFNLYEYLEDFTILACNEALEITEKTFENATRLKKLQIQANFIKTLNADMFKNMRKIEYIDASFNLIEMIDVKLFQELENLKHIDLSQNKIIKIEAGTFDNLRLNKLLLDSNYLTDFDFKNLNISNKLNIFSNNLGDITKSSFTSDLEIQVLDLSSNQIPKLYPKFMKHFKKLKDFNAENNLIEYLYSDTFEGLYNLKEIRLNYNRISVIEKGTFYNQNLNDLTLTENILIEFDFFNLTAKKINIEHNLLTSLTINGNVEFLYASYNKISRIDIVTRSLEDLQTNGNAEDLQIKYV